MLTKDDIISKLKIDDLPEIKQDEIIARLETLIQRKATLEISHDLAGRDISDDPSDTTMSNFDGIIKNVSGEVVKDFINKTA